MTLSFISPSPHMNGGCPRKGGPGLERGPQSADGAHPMCPPPHLYQGGPPPPTPPPGGPPPHLATIQAHVVAHHPPDHHSSLLDSSAQAHIIGCAPPNTNKTSWNIKGVALCLSCLTNNLIKYMHENKSIEMNIDTIKIFINLMAESLNNLFHLVHPITIQIYVS